MPAKWSLCYVSASGQIALVFRLPNTTTTSHYQNWHIYLMELLKKKNIGINGK